MSSFQIIGGQRLHGSITPQGAKNEALQVICAVLLTEQAVTISNIPAILDVLNLIKLLEYLGVKVEQLNTDTYRFTAGNIDLAALETETFYRQSASLRGSVMLVGPLVARFGRAVIPKPGGDKIGRRRLDTHFIGIQKLGAEFNFDPDNKLYRIEAKELRGCYMLLDEASVTGTANIIMTAVLAEGEFGQPVFKPDFDPNYLLSMPYIGGLGLIRRDSLLALDGIAEEIAQAEAGVQKAQARLDELLAGHCIEIEHDGVGGRGRRQCERSSHKACASEFHGKPLQLM